MNLKQNYILSPKYAVSKKNSLVKRCRAGRLGFLRAPLAAVTSSFGAFPFESLLCACLAVLKFGNFGTGSLFPVLKFPKFW